MNTHDTDLPAALRMQLRALREDIAPPAHVWDAIDARLDTSQRAPASMARRVPYAMAAALGVAALAGAWAWSTLPRATSTTTALTASAPIADPGLRDAFAALDRDARRIRDALRHDPDSRVLLHQLHRVDAIRQTLAQRAALG